MAVATFIQPDRTVQDGMTYTANIDAAIKALMELAANFAPHQSSTANMTITVDVGKMLVGSTYTLKAQQITATIVAPTTNPRIDRVVIDMVTGNISVITGTQAASPAAPAIPAGKMPVCQVLLQTTTTTILNATITDERPLLQLSSALTVGNANGNIPVSNSALNVNLNADLLDGLSSSEFVQRTTATAQSMVGNLAVGGINRAWAANIKAVDIGPNSAVVEGATGNIVIVANTYFDGVNWRYISNGFAALQESSKSTGVIDILTAASGLAGNVVTFTPRLTITNDGTAKINGNVKVGVEAVPAWAATMRVVDIGNLSAIVEEPAGGFNHAHNAYNDGTDWRSRAIGSVSVLRHIAGGVVILTGQSLAANAIIVFTERFSVSNDGTTRVNGNIVRHNGNIFHGRVDSAGVAIRLPAGWTSAKVAVGQYRITHNLGTANYTLSPSGSIFGDYYVSGFNDVNSSEFYTRRASTEAAADRGFNFTLILD